MSRESQDWEGVTDPKLYLGTLTFRLVEIQWENPTGQWDQICEARRDG